MNKICVDNFKEIILTLDKTLPLLSFDIINHEEIKSGLSERNFKLDSLINNEKEILSLSLELRNNINKYIKYSEGI